MAPAHHQNLKMSTVGDTPAPADCVQGSSLSILHLVQLVSHAWLQCCSAPLNMEQYLIEPFLRENWVVNGKLPLDLSHLLFPGDMYFAEELRKR